MQRTLKSTITSVMSSTKPKWGADESRGSELDGRFSRLEEMEDLRPLGHGVNVRGGQGDAGSGTERGGEEAGGLRQEEMVVPSRRIGVKTDVVVETSERLAYNDRLY